MASRPTAGKDPPPRAAATMPAHLVFTVGGQGYLLTHQFRRPAWAKLVDTHAASSRPPLRRAAREQITFAAALRRTFGHQIAPVGQKGQSVDAVERAVTLIAQNKLFLFRLGEAPPVPTNVAKMRIDVVPARAPGASDAAPADLGERFAIVLEGIRDIPVRQLGGEAAELLAALAVGGAVLRIAALLAAWIASHFTPVGWIIDAGMIGYGIWCVGLGFVDTMKRLLEIAAAIKGARTKADLRAQSLPLAKLFIEAGVSALLAFFLKGVSKRKRGSGAAQDQTPAAPTPAKKPPPVQGKSEPAPATGAKAAAAAGAASGFKTKPDEAVFWSGLGRGGDKAAAEMARAKGGKTLEMLIEERGIKMPVWDAADPASVKAWQDASAAFAKGASGDVRAVLGANLRPGNIWETFELPALKANPAVNRIFALDPVTGAKTLIWGR